MVHFPRTADAYRASMVLNCFPGDGESRQRFKLQAGLMLGSFDRVLSRPPEKGCFSGQLAELALGRESLTGPS